MITLAYEWNEMKYVWRNEADSVFPKKGSQVEIWGWKQIYKERENITERRRWWKIGGFIYEGRPSIYTQQSYLFGQKWPTPTLYLALLHLANAKNKKLSGLSLLLADTLTIYFTTFIIGFL